MLAVPAGLYAFPRVVETGCLVGLSQVVSVVHLLVGCAGSVETSCGLDLYATLWPDLVLQWL